MFSNDSVSTEVRCKEIIVTKLILTLGIALLAQNALAGALPPTWYSCKAQRKAADGRVLTFEGNGIHEVEASENAIYRCRLKENKAVTGCKVTSCTWEDLRD